MCSIQQNVLIYLIFSRVNLAYLCIPEYCAYLYKHMVCPNRLVQWISQAPLSGPRLHSNASPSNTVNGADNPGYKSTIVKVP